MSHDSGCADPDDEGSLLRPAWEDTPDETDADRGLRQPRPEFTDPTDEPRALLIPLCAATDALARLDARTEAADNPVREGLIARLAITEAAGCLTHVHAWAHPLDLALREAGLTASTALAATGDGRRTLPQTFSGPAAPRDWTDPPFEALADSDRSMAEALALARALRCLACRTGTTTATDTTDVMAALQALGTGAPDPARVAPWWCVLASPPVSRRPRFGRWRGEEAPPSLPALLIAAEVAETWMEASFTADPTPAQAVFLAAAVLARSGPTRHIFLPVWAAYPALGFGDRATLPTLRSDAADRLLGWGPRVTWPLTFLHLVAESARMGLRELERLEAAATKGRALTTHADKRSRLPDTVDALLRSPALAPKALAAKLRIAPQTATALLRDLQARGIIRELTGRGSFRAFAI